MYKLERTVLKIQGPRALEETFQSEFVRVDLDTSGEEPVGVFEKILPEGEGVGLVNFTKRLLGDALLDLTREVLEEEDDGGCADSDTEEIEAGESDLSEDWTVAEEEEPDFGEDDDAETGSSW